MLQNSFKDGNGGSTVNFYLGYKYPSQMSEKDSKEEILKAFKLFDDDDTGRISFSNLKRVADEGSVNY